MLVADYGRGTTSAADVRAALAAARGPGGLGPASPRRRPGARRPAGHAERRRGRAGGRRGVAPASGLAAVGARAEALIRTWGVGAVAVTLGARGALLSYGEGAPHGGAGGAGDRRRPVRSR